MPRPSPPSPAPPASWAGSDLAERRDYVERLIERAIRAIAIAADRRRGQDVDAALSGLREAQRDLLGDSLTLVEQLEAASAVSIAGADAVRVYAALAVEEAAVRAEAGDESSAWLCASRARELYAALDAAGEQLGPHEQELRARLGGLPG